MKGCTEKLWRAAEKEKDLKWRSVVACIAATALAAGAWLGISNSNGKSTEATAARRHSHNKRAV